MSLMPFLKKKTATTDEVNPQLEAFLLDFSIEVMPRTTY